MIDFTPFIRGYAEELKIKNYSQLTIKQTIWHLKEFTLFLKDYPLRTLEEITEEHIKDYRRYRHYCQNRYGRSDTIPVQNRHLACLKGFFGYLKKESLILKDPAGEIEYAKVPKTLPKSALTHTEMKNLLRGPNTKTLTGYRDRTIMETLYSSGIRKSELLNLKCEDVDYRDGYLRVNQGKGNKDRIAPIGKISCRYLENYIKGIRPCFYHAKEEEALFLSKRGLPLSRNALGDMIIKYAKASKLEKHITTHTFRRSCATEMIKNKANLMHLKELLGHNSMESIQSYCDLTITDLKEAHRKCHPREKENMV